LLTIDDLNFTSSLIRSHVVLTPLVNTRIDGRTLSLKLELFQNSGSFKLRGALANVLALSREELVKGLTAVSGGNHAVAVAYTANRLGTSAKVVMPRELASEFRVSLCKSLGATVELPSGRLESFQRANQIAIDEGRFFVPPFDSLKTIAGTGTIGLEISAQNRNVKKVYVAIGGGGLAAGVALALKLKNPDIVVIGVEPAGADLMKRSLAQNAVVKDENVNSIADGLTPPFVGAHCLEYCRLYLDDVITVSDQAIKYAMVRLAEEAKVFAEPAGAAALAGFLLHSDESTEDTVCLISGGNISVKRFTELIG
jgi:threonine dehydratase